jgi:hypothetical protein
VALAEFAEKTFETAYDIELATGSGGNPAVFAPSQVFEHLLGFDAAADPGKDHVLWKVLSAPRPHGLVLRTDSWSGSGLAAPNQALLPSFLVSYIVQFKRPEFLRGARAKQWALWGGPYFRFGRDATQQRVLKRLEVNLGDQAVVRYAAPAFHTSSELDAARWAREIIALTGHVAPTTLADHRVWTYQAADSPGRGNPSGPLRNFDTFRTLFRPSEAAGVAPRAPREVMRADEVANHVHTLASVAKLREPRLREVIAKWNASLLEAGVDARNRSIATSFATVQTILSWNDARWWLLDGASRSR